MAIFFKCKAKTETEYCKKWLRQCIGENNCAQGYCIYCNNAALNPKIESICNKCDLFEWKKENYNK